MDLNLRCSFMILIVFKHMFKEQQNREKHPDCTTINCEGKLPPEIIVALVLIVVVLCFGVPLLFLWIYRKKIEKLKRDYASMEQEEMVEKRPAVGTSDSASMEQEEMVEKRPAVGISDDLQVLGKIEGELVFEDIYLSSLLMRHCRNGVFKNFIYLFETIIMKKKNDEYDVNLLKILTSRDKDGYTLLLCAAEGGSVDIFKALTKAMEEINRFVEMKDKIKIDDTTYNGRSVLHLACMNKHRSLCRELLIDDGYKDLLLYKTSVQDWNAAHFAAVGGDTNIMDNLEKNNLDIKVETKNGLTILDIACIHNNTEMCKDLMNRKNLRLSLDKSDARGWTIAHFAAMVGNTDIFDNLIAKNIKMVKTKNQKNILHICCEYGNEDLCIRILKHFGKMVYDKDDKDWNTLHYAAKGGNLVVFKKIETFFNGRLCETTRDERTVLHIACINNRVEICQYICNQKHYKSIINSRGEFRDWTAAHYVAVEERHDGTEKSLIRILVNGGIDLCATTVDGLTVLGVACEHRNRNLINFLLNEYYELLGVGKKYLETAAKASNDKYIEARIKEALQNYHGKTVNVEVPPEDDGTNIRFARKQVSEENVAIPAEEGRDGAFSTEQGSEENEALLVLR